MSEAAHDQLSLEGWERLTDTDFVDLIGPIWRSRHDDGQLQFGFRIEDKHLNRNGLCHGGMLMTVLDHAMAMASWEANGYRRQATIQFETQFVAKAEKGDFVIIHPQVMRTARNLVFMRAVGWVGEKMVLSASGVWTVFSSRVVARQDGGE